MRSQKKSWHRYTRPYRQVPRIYDESDRDPLGATLSLDEKKLDKEWRKKEYRT